MDSVPVHCGEERAELKEEALELLIDPCSYPRLWSWVVCSKQKSKIADTSHRNEILLLGVWAGCMGRGTQIILSSQSANVTPCPLHCLSGIRVNCG